MDKNRFLHPAKSCYTRVLSCETSLYTMTFESHWHLIGCKKMGKMVLSFMYIDLGSSSMVGPQASLV